MKTPEEIALEIYERNKCLNPLTGSNWIASIEKAILAERTRQAESGPFCPCVKEIDRLKQEISEAKKELGIASENNLLFRCKQVMNKLSELEEKNKWLQSANEILTGSQSNGKEYLGALQKIISLEASVAVMREALRKIRNHQVPMGGSMVTWYGQIQNIVEEALTSQPSE